MLIKIKSSIQGHYKAGPNWQVEMLQCHLLTDIVVHQIDNFYAALKSEDFVYFLSKLKKYMNIEREGILGMDYNGFTHSWLGRETKCKEYEYKIDEASSFEDLTWVQLLFPSWCFSILCHYC